MVRVVRPDVFVVMPGFRMSHRPVEGEIDVACSIALATFARDDFAKADFEFLYAGLGHTGEREFHVFRGRDRKIYDRDAVDHLLDIYVKGVSLAMKSGAAAERPDLHWIQDYRSICAITVLSSCIISGYLRVSHLFARQGGGAPIGRSASQLVVFGVRPLFLVGTMWPSADGKAGTSVSSHRL